VPKARGSRITVDKQVTQRLQKLHVNWPNLMRSCCQQSGSHCSISNRMSAEGVPSAPTETTRGYLVQI